MKAAFGVVAVGCIVSAGIFKRTIDVVDEMVVVSS